MLGGTHWYRRVQVIGQDLSWVISPCKERRVELKRKKGPCARKDGE